MIKNIPKQIPVSTSRMLELMRADPALSTKEWCEKIGISQTNLDGYRKGTRSFTLEQIIRAAKHHNTTMDYICGLTDAKAKPGETLQPIEMIEEGLRILKNKDANQR